MGQFLVDINSYLVQEHAMAVGRACKCVGLNRSNYYREPTPWTVRDAKIIGALAQLVEGRPNRGFWMCRKHLRRQGRPGITSVSTASISSCGSI